MNHIKIPLFIFLVLNVCFCRKTNASNENKVFFIEQEVQRLDPSQRYLIEDSNSIFKIEELITTEGWEYFEKNDRPINYNEHKLSSYWLKIIIKNNSYNSTWLIEFPDPHIGTLQLFMVTNGIIKEYAPVGFELPFKNRTLENKNFVYEVSIPQNSQIEIYARIKSSGFCGIDPNIRSVSNFSAYFFTEYHLLGLYYGIIFILIAYNFFLGLYSKENMYFFYCLYTISCALFTFAEDGLGFQWLWPNFPIMNVLLSKFASILLLISFLLYADSFLELRRNYSKVRMYLLAGTVFYIFCVLFLPDYYRFNNFLITILFSITCFSAIKIFQNGYSPARFFVLGNSVILASMFVYFFRMNGWIDSNMFTIYLFNFGFVFEAVVLSISLSDKFRITKEEKDFAQRETIHQLQINDSLQQKVNKELESKVKERTKELETKTDELQVANNKLELLKRELYAMNSKMDVNIWELKKEVKKEVQARVLNDTISLEEFSAVYTEVYCYQYLRDLKWKDGFVCPKCGNKKSGRGNNNFTLKCTQCQHQESVTSNTLFHAIKFPISKAFYLAYYLHKNGNDVSYEELALKLDLSKNTVWKFGKKVIQIVEEMGKKAKASDAWDKLIMTNL